VIRREKFAILDTFGFNEGMLNALASEKDSGIPGDEADLARRTHKYGNNAR